MPGIFRNRCGHVVVALVNRLAKLIDAVIAYLHGKRGLALFTRLAVVQCSALVGDARIMRGKNPTTDATRTSGMKISKPHNGPLLYMLERTAIAESCQLRLNGNEIQHKIISGNITVTTNTVSRMKAGARPVR